MDTRIDNDFYRTEEDELREKRIIESEARYREDIRVLLEMPEFKRVLNSWLGRMGLFSYIWRKGADVHNSSSRHDAALEIYMDIRRSSEQLAAEIYNRGVSERMSE